MIREKQHHLARALYRGPIFCAFTVCVQDRRELFVSDVVYRVCQKTLFEETERQHCLIHVSLFMPDHVHVLLEGLKEESDLWQCIVMFKQKTGYWLGRNGYTQEWQKNFFDHILRRDEDIQKQVRYILDNPVRKGLVASWKVYHYKGSTVYDLNSPDFEPV